MTAEPESVRSGAPVTFKRTELQRFPSSIPGWRIVQSLAKIPEGVASGRHSHPGPEVGYIARGSGDSVLNAALAPLRYPTGRGEETAVEFAIDPEKFRDAFAADLPEGQAAAMAATQRPVSEPAFTEPNGAPAWEGLPSWAVVPIGDGAAGADVVRSMAERAGAETTEVEGSHVNHDLSAAGRRGRHPGRRGRRPIETLQRRAIPPRDAAVCALGMR